jgi:hypothetical protein
VSDIWLIEAVPEAFKVTEQHRLKFAIGDNSQAEYLEAHLDAVIRLPADGNIRLSQRSMARARAAQKAGGESRVGIFGLAAPIDDSSISPGARRRSLDGVLEESGPPPLNSGDAGVRTWALNLPEELVTSLSEDAPGAEEQVCVFEFHSLISKQEFPLNLEAELAVYGDDLLASLEHLAYSGELDAAKKVASAVACRFSNRSIFCIDIQVKSFRSSDDQAWLKRFVLDWPSGGDGIDVVLLIGGQDPPRTLTGRYDPSSKQVEFLSPEPVVLPGNPGRLLVKIDNPTVLSRMKPLTGRLEVEVNRLASGLRPFIAGVSGEIQGGLGVTGTAGLVPRTVMAANFLIDLASKFRARPIAQQTRFQFPGLRFREDQLQQISTLFRNVVFTPPTVFSLSDANQSTGYLLTGNCRVGGNNQYLVVLVSCKQREVSLERAGSNTKETGTVPLDDVVVDMAAVGPDYARLSELLGELQRGMATILGGI